MAFINTRKILGLGIEATQGSGNYSAVPTMTASHFNFRTYNIVYSPEINMAKRAYATGDYAKYEEIAGKRLCGVTFDVDLAPVSTASSGASLGNAPAWGKVAECCGLSATASGNSYSLITSKYMTNRTATIQINEWDEGASAQQFFVKIAGAMGTMKMIMDEVGYFVRMSFDFKGRLESMSDIAKGSIITPVMSNSTKATGVLSATISAISQTLDCEKIEFDLGNTLGILVNPAGATGIKGANIVDTEPTLTADPTMKLLATDAFYTTWTGNTTGAFNMTVGTNLQMNAGALQLQNAYQPGDRDGNVVNNLTFGAKRHATNPVFEINQE